MFNVAEAKPVMREVILPGVREYTNTATVTLKLAERETQASPTGEFIITYNKEMNNNAASGRAEDGENLPAARASKYGRSIVPSMQLYTSAKWTGKVIAATSSRDSLINALVEESRRATVQHKHSKNRQILGDGRDAIGFYVSGAGANNGVVSDQFGNIAGDFLQSGTTHMDLINGSNNTVRQANVYVVRGAVGGTGRAVTYFDAAGAPLNLSGAAVAGDYFVLNGQIVGGARRAFMGLRGIINNANTPLEGANGLQGVPVANVPEFAAIVRGDDANVVDLKVSDFQAILGELDITAGGDEGGAEGIKVILTSQPGYETVAELFRTERIQVNTMTLDGGFTGIMLNGKYPIVADKHVRLGAYFFWNPSSTKLFVLKDIDWDESDGSMFFRIQGGERDAVGATLKEYGEFGVTTRNANGLLKGVRMIR